MPSTLGASPAGNGLVTSTRMYDVAPAARLAWQGLFGQAQARAGIPVSFIDHGWPTPIAELWSRPGLCGAFMCGWPFAMNRQAGRMFIPVAGVVPDFPAYEGKPRYRSEFLVRDNAAWSCLDDAVACRYGWMVRDSQSGWNAPRQALASLASRHGPKLFAESKGPYGNPRGLLAALRSGEIDLTAADGWYLDLLRIHDPAALAGVRTLAYTAWTPNPLLVAAPDVDPAEAMRLSHALYAMHEDPDCLPLLHSAHVARFVPVAAAEYDVFLNEAGLAAYPEIC